MRRWMVGGRLAVVACWVGLALPVMAQAGAAKFAFDAVSIKPHETSDGSVRVRTTNDRYSASGMSLAGLIVFAYGIQMESQVIGLSGPLKSARFDIEAKIDAETVETLKQFQSEERFNKLRGMTRAVLEERFKLKAHLEKKEMPIYSLVVAKAGSKLKMIEGSNVPPDAINDGETVKRGGNITIRNSAMTAEGIPLSMLAENLQGQVNRVVRDDTGLRGNYDFTLQWTRDELREASAESGAMVSFPSLFTALQEQLGLRLEPAKGPVDSVVVDHVEMPSEN